MTMRLPVLWEVNWCHEDILPSQLKRHTHRDLYRKSDFLLQIKRMSKHLPFHPVNHWPTHTHTYTIIHHPWAILLVFLRPTTCIFHQFPQKSHHDNYLLSTQFFWRFLNVCLFPKFVHAFVPWTEMRLSRTWFFTENSCEQWQKNWKRFLAEKEVRKVHILQTTDSILTSSRRHLVLSHFSQKINEIQRNLRKI